MTTAQTREHPILFTGEMVRAILSGRKFQTRRVVKEHYDADAVGRIALRQGGFAYRFEWHADGAIRYEDIDPPYSPGDTLWVREKFQPYITKEATDSYGEPISDLLDYETGKGYAVNYPATDGVEEFYDYDKGLTSACKPSIHMPRWASRITLEVTDVRVERVQDISEEDAQAEGASSVFRVDIKDFYSPGFNAEKASSYRIGFERLWDSINESRGYSWASNPWVWAVTFKRREA